MKKKTPLLSTTFIHRFEGSCGTFGEEKKNLVVCPWVSLPKKKINLKKKIKNNDLEMDVSMIIVI
jgi:hypothetical protein